MDCWAPSNGVPEKRAYALNATTRAIALLGPGIYVNSVIPFWDAADPRFRNVDAMATGGDAGWRVVPGAHEQVAAKALNTGVA